MLQRGIETPDMDVRWVSSLSWYFLNFFGLNGLYRLILGNENGNVKSRTRADLVTNVIAAADSSQSMMTSPFAAQQAGPTPVQDFNKLFKAERDNLEFSEGMYNWSGHDVENRVLRRYGKLPSQ